MAAVILIFSVGMVLYIYAGYPLAAAVLARVRARKVRQADLAPTVSILIAAYNEEEVIAATVLNKLSLDYPGARLEVIVVSDGSNDGTDAAVKAIADPRLRLLRQYPRAGKTAALNAAVQLARGEILVFSDANSLFRPDALGKLVRNFADPQVGYVTGKMVYVDARGTIAGDGCGAYMRYENWLRRQESAFGSVIGVDGGIDAVRRALYRPMRPDQLPDFVLPLAVVDQGYRVVYEPEALLHEASLENPRDEYRMRVRVSLRALWALKDMRHLLAPWRDPVFAWQLWSHKVLRYLSFLFLGGAFLANAALWNAGAPYRLLFSVQILAYAGAALFHCVRGAGQSRPLRFLYYFLLVNAAAAHAFGKFLLGRKQVLWTPRKG
ncbi:MAG: glycosyltransferase family 2 protein [Desulfuromonadales bacterium]